MAFWGKILNSLATGYDSRHEVTDELDTNRCMQADVGSSIPSSADSILPPPPRLLESRRGSRTSAGPSLGQRQGEDVFYSPPVSPIPFASTGSTHGKASEQLDKPTHQDGNREQEALSDSDAKHAASKFATSSVGLYPPSASGPGSSPNSWMARRAFPRLQTDSTSGIDGNRGRNPSHTQQASSSSTQPIARDDAENGSDDDYDSLTQFGIADLTSVQDLKRAPKLQSMLREAVEQYKTSNDRQEPQYDIHRTHRESATSTSLMRRFSFKTKPDEAGGIAMPLRKGTGDSLTEDDLDDEGYCCKKSKRAAEADKADISYCYQCQMIYCTKCWDKQAPHRKKNSLHNKVDHKIAKVIQETLDVDLSENEQAQLHLLDESASWFGAIHGSDGVVFRDFGRYASLVAERSFAHRKSVFPALVSFVGDTGAGKSSVIKLLVGVKTSIQQPTTSTLTQTPVVGNKDASVPTSGDVHLYADPATFFSNQPILYADCEGLRGGTREPVGARRRRKVPSNTSTRARTASFERQVRRKYETAERDILWATTPETSTRKYFVEHLYPRLLYTFSDVIVFVVWNARMVEDVFEQLIIWANAVIESAYNQPVLPHAVVVLNGSDNTDEELWDVDKATNKLLEEMKQAIHFNPRLKGFANKWNARRYKVASVQDLLTRYYSSIKIVRIPKRDSPERVHQQVQCLYGEIQRGVGLSHRVKQEKRLRLNAEALQPYLQRAFDHFCRDLEEPFDFIKASFADKGIPQDFSGNTLKLAVAIMKQWPSTLDGPTLFRELSFIVASCVMLDTVRNSKLGTASGIFKEYLDHFDETLDDFCEKIWPCEFVTNQGRCVNVRAGHTKGHQLNGKGHLIAGQYQSDFTADRYRDQFRNDIHFLLQELLHRLHSSSRPEQEEARRLHKNHILGPFYKHVGGADKFISHSTCLCCLVSPAEHWLPCGHILCTRCVRDWGYPRAQDTIEMRYCPLHEDDTTYWRQTISIKPDHAGVRVLCLDGGGVRGILMLQALERIEKDMRCLLPIHAFFDLMIGTSTGGIIALGLVEKGWSVRTCLQKFEELVNQAFQRHTPRWFGLTDFALAPFTNGRCKTEPLEDLLLRQFGSQNLFGGKREGSEYEPRNFIHCKVAVTATSTDGSPYLLANYNRVSKDDERIYKFLRDEAPSNEIKVWEAARATSAAPKIFKAYAHEASGHTFVDGGVYFNNPLEIALAEQNLIWPQKDGRSRLPDVVLSLGTGHSAKVRQLQNTPVATAGSSLLSYYKQLLKIAVDHVKSSQKSEEEYQRLKRMHSYDSDVERRFMRLNTKFDRSLCKPDDSASLADLKMYAEEDLDARPEEIRIYANRLIASSFYFEPAQDSMRKDADGRIEIRGTIRCRFHSSSLRSFGDILTHRIQQAASSRAGSSHGHSPCFVIEDRSRPDEAEQVLLSDSVLDGMKIDGSFNLKQITLRVSNSVVESNIYLRFGNEELWDQNSISGFPRHWDDSRLKPMASRLLLSELRGRQLSVRRRPDWIEPNHTPPRVLDDYARTSNPGLRSDERLRAIERQLKQPSVSFSMAHELDTAESSLERESFDLQAWPRREFVTESSVELPVSFDNFHELE